jgi:hypothetical protein
MFEESGMLILPTRILFMDANGKETAGTKKRFPDV